MKVIKDPLKLYASPTAVIAGFLQLPGNNRIENIISRVKNLSDSEVTALTEQIKADFSKRHRDIEAIFSEHFEKISGSFPEDTGNFSTGRKLLLGAFFTKEYSIEAAALFNPSIVPHPDQSNLTPGGQRFIMSLRATGEGHISSIVFKTGVVEGDGHLTLDEESDLYSPLKRNDTAVYDKEFVRQRIKNFLWYNDALLDDFPNEFTAAAATAIMNGNASSEAAVDAFYSEFQHILDSNYQLSPSSMPLTGIVIFPGARSECMGMEDVRFVQFKENGRTTYYGTYTAYNGREIRTQLIETGDFKAFTIRTLYGPAVSDKGMALFPEKVNGKYAMISRQGGEKINIMFSDDLYFWNEYLTLMEPAFPWEFVQLGNCGSPIKTDEGWLLLTHGVGAMRTYVISAVLLQTDDPSIIKARLSEPLIKADENEREGYVPNVVYTCGVLKHKDLLLIPYAVSDSATGFATVRLDELINEMKSN